MQIFLDSVSRIPIYEQIEQEVVRQIQQGSLKPNEQLPSLRQLASQLSLNINTVKRAFSELESKGITYSVAGKGIFVSQTAKQEDCFLQEALEKAEEALVHAKNLGATQETLETILKKIYKGEHANDSI